MTPEESTENFTDQELEVILGLCRGRGRTLPNKEIAEEFGITEDIVMTTMMSIFDQTGLSGRWELFEFVKAALNSELRRRLGDSPRPKGLS